MSPPLVVRFDQDGGCRFIYEDHHPLLRGLGQAVTQRASHVEPTPDGQWQADLGPIGGPCLPVTATRQEALAAEVAWLERRLLQQEE